MHNPSARAEQRRERRQAAKQDAKRQKNAIDNPMYWAAGAEAKIQGILQQVEQHFTEDHPLRMMLTRQRDELSDYIFDGSVPDEVENGAVDARLVLVPQVRGEDA